MRSRDNFIEEACTITAKGQTTVPKSVRRALRVDCGGKIAFRVENDRVTVHNARREHVDPALGAFLKLIENDIAAGKRVHDLPRLLRTAMRQAAKTADVDIGEELTGDVDL